MAPSLPQLKVALTPPRTPVDAFADVDYPKLSYDAEVEMDLDLYGFSLDVFMRAMSEYSPNGKFPNKDIACKFMSMPLEVRIKRLQITIDELDSHVVLNTRRILRWWMT